MPSLESFYYIDEETGRTVGPFSLPVLEKMKSSGLITDETLVLGETQEQWRPYGDWSSQDTVQTEIPNKSTDEGTPSVPQPEDAGVSDNQEILVSELKQIDGDQPSLGHKSEKTESRRHKWFDLEIGLFLLLSMVALLVFVFLSRRSVSPSSPGNVTLPSSIVPSTPDSGVNSKVELTFPTPPRVSKSGDSSASYPPTSTAIQGAYMCQTPFGLEKITIGPITDPGLPSGSYISISVGLGIVTSEGTYYLNRGFEITLMPGDDEYSLGRRTVVFDLDVNRDCTR